MVATVLRVLVAAAAWPPHRLVRRLRRVGAARRVVVLRLGAGGRGRLGRVDAQLRLLRWLARDPAVAGVEVHLRAFSGGHARAHEAHALLLRLRRSGRRVAVFLESPGTLELLVASAAHRVLVVPPAEALLDGPTARAVYLGGLLRRLGVAVEAVATGPYKSAAEPLSRAFPGRGQREQLASLLDDLHRQAVDAIAEARGLDRDAVEAAMRASPLPADELVRRGLADEVAWPDELPAAAERLLGRPARRVPAARVLPLLLAERLLGRLAAGPARSIAVLPLAGVIGSPGEAPRARLDPERVERALDALGRDPSVAAVVLRIRSPGGGALASERIARAVDRLGRRRPVVAVIEDVGASGAYLLAVRAHRLLADPASLTGSIGVVAARVAPGPALARAGVHVETVHGGPGPALDDPVWPPSPAGLDRLRRLVDRAYDRFLDAVAAGRRMPRRRVEALAGGRVWSGRQALAHGLVDELGGWEEGVRAARRLLGPGAGRLRVVHLDPPAPRGPRLARLLRGDLAGLAWPPAGLDGAPLLLALTPWRLC